MASTQVALGIAGRSLKLIPRLPSTFIPSLVMPVFLTIAFSGPFSGLVRLPGFPAVKIIDWVVPMTTLMGSAFAGVTTGMGVARDLETGFYDRLLASPVKRSALIGGTLLAAVCRALIPICLLLVVALIGRAHFFGGLAGIGVLALAGFGMAFLAGCWAMSLALRFKSLQAAPLMAVGIFITVFLSTAQMPLEFLTGWLHTVARFNPMTNILALARQGFLGDVTWQHTWPGLVSLAGMATLLFAFAARSMQKVIP
ncbi:MAG TPA: ABC transporter permease [Actinomycetota bacterium]|nr:ABC transporter permease [Actinomycetota bacterium]